MSDITFRDFAGALMGNDLDAASRHLSVLIGVDDGTARSSTEYFLGKMSSEPAFMQQAMGMREVVNSGTRADLIALLGSCFALDAAASEQAADVVWARYRS